MAVQGGRYGQLACCVGTIIALASACGSSGSRVPEATVFGGDRPVELLVPDSYEPDRAAPLLLVLHGYGTSGAFALEYSGLDRLGNDSSYLILAPDGTRDSNGFPFWHAKQGTGVDDVAYLGGLLDEISSVWNVDPVRVSVFGHSNGAFMAYRLACDRADAVSAVISLAGATPIDPDSCSPELPVSIAEIHGDDDEIVLYEGSDSCTDLPCPYPGTRQGLAYWASYDGCDGEMETDPARVELDANIPGAETRIERYRGCPAGIDLELWTMEQGGHFPRLRSEAYERMRGFLEAHSR
jgi:polyhydroxybutyrate depolymerase